MNCKPGDLAITVGSEVGAENVGRFVKILHEAGEYNGAASWWVETSDGQPLRTKDGAYRSPSIGLDRNLRPIRGLPQSTTRQEPQKEIA